MVFRVLFVLTLFVLKLESSRVDYSNHKVIRLIPKTSDQLDLIIGWERDLYFDICGKIRNIGNAVDICLSNKTFDLNKSLFDENNIEYKILNHDLQKSIDIEKSKTNYSKSKRNVSQIVGKYATYDEIIKYLDYLANAYPSLASTYLIGTTLERRNLKVLKLKAPNSNRSVWIDCGIHAREWISVSTCIWIIDRLINEHIQSNHSFNSSTNDLLDSYEVHVLPILNPDGYDYTFTTDRLWRKNRNPNGNRGCYGVDLNRNFGYMWMHGGSSSNKCSQTYAGSSADSEIEVKSVEKALLSKVGEWDAYITLHTYGQLWLTSYGYTAELPPNYDDLYAKALIGVEAIKKVYGTQFKIETGGQLYIASGGSDDWATEFAKIKYSYTLELRPDETDSREGFIISEDQAPLAGEETYQGIKALLNKIRSPTNSTNN